MGDETPQNPASNAVPVVDQSGTLYTVDPSELGQAMQSGLRPVTDQNELAALYQKAQYGSGAGNAAKAFGLGVARGLTFGTSDLALAETGAVDRSTLKGLAEEQGLASGAGHVAGALLPLIGTGGEAAPLEGAEAATEGAGALGRLGQAAGDVGKVLGAPVRGVAKLGEGVGGAVSEALGGGAVGELGGAVARGAVEMPFYGAGDRLSEDVFENKPLTAESILADAGKDAVLGGLTGGALEGAIGLGRRYVPELFDRASAALERLAKKAEPAAVDSSADIRELTKTIGRTNDNVEAALKDYYTKARPKLLEQMLGGSDAAGADAAEALGAARSKLAEAEFATPVGAKAKQIFETAQEKLEGASTDAERFQILDKAKRDFDAFRAPKGPLATPADVLLYGKLDEARQVLRGVLEDEGVFGPAAAYQREVNSALAPYFDARNTLKGKFFEKFGQERIASPQKATAFVGRAARNSPLADTSHQALQDYIQSAKDALDTLSSNTYEALGRKNVHIDQVGRDLEAIPGASQKAIESKRAELTMKSGAVKGDPVLGWTHVPGIPGVLADGLHQNSGALVGALAAHAVGVPLPLIAAGAGAAMVAGVARGAKSEVVAAAARSAAKVSEKISIGASRALGERAAGKALDAAPAIGSSLSEYGQAKSGETRVEAYRRRIAELDAHRVDADRQAEDLAVATKGLQPHAPQLAGHIQRVMVSKDEYLRAHAPRDPVPPSGMPGQREYRPSQAELDKWERIHRAVMYPLSILDDLRRGRVTPEAVDAVRSTSPELYQAMVEQLRDRLAERTEPLDFQQTLQIGLFTGAPTSYALQMLPRTQAIYAPAGAPGGAPAAAGQPRVRASGLAHINEADRSASRFTKGLKP